MKCAHCDKIYVSMGCYENHVKLCNWGRQGKINASTEELCEIVQFLLKKCDTLEKDMAKLKQTSRIRVKKTISEILNESPVPRLSWDEYMSSLELNNEDLLMIFKEDFENGFINLINKYSCGENIPISCFTQEEKTIYIYTTKWIKMQDIHMNKWINHIQAKLSVLLKIWRENASLKEIEKYDVYTRCIYGFNFENHKLVTSLKRKTYTLLKK